MNFQKLCDHFAQYGVNCDPLDEDSYWATNVYSFQQCRIQQKSRYDVITLCHYFYELGIPCPLFMRDDYNNYRSLRNNLFESFGVPQVEADRAEKETDEE